MAFDLTGRIALITGASSGLGAHFAEIFVAAGARVVIGARRIDRVEALAAELGEGLDAGGLGGGDDHRLVAQDRQGQAVGRQQHVGPHHGEVGAAVFDMTYCVAEGMETFEHVRRYAVRDGQMVRPTEKGHAS